MHLCFGFEILCDMEAILTYYSGQCDGHRSDRWRVYLDACICLALKNSSQSSGVISLYHWVFEESICAAQDSNLLMSISCQAATMTKPSVHLSFNFISTQYNAAEEEFARTLARRSQFYTDVYWANMSTQKRTYHCFSVPELMSRFK